MKSKKKIVPIPPLNSNKSVPSYSRTGDISDDHQHTIIHPPPANNMGYPSSVQMEPNHKKNSSVLSTASNASGASSVYHQTGKRSPFGIKPLPNKPLPNRSLPLGTPSRSPYGSTASSNTTHSRSSHFGSNANHTNASRESSSNWTPVQHAHHIKINQR